jgi:hypothetical protein
VSPWITLSFGTRPRLPSDKSKEDDEGEQQHKEDGGIDSGGGRQ